MEYFLIPLFTFIASIITFLAGFGINTILVPVFALFFEIKYAIALTAVIHLLHNIFKLILTAKYADKSIIISFGLPAVVSSFIGVYALNLISNLKPLITYNIFHHDFSISLLKLVIAFLIIFFAFYDLIPQFQAIAFKKKLMPLGGLISGFLGGLSGHQGALRSAFLIKSNLSKESFIGTGVIIAFMVDLSRLALYFTLFAKEIFHSNIMLISISTVFAILGAIIGNHFLKKVSFESIKIIVNFMIIVFGILLGSGVI